MALIDATMDKIAGRGARELPDPARPDPASCWRGRRCTAAAAAVSAPRHIIGSARAARAGARSGRSTAWPANDDEADMTMGMAAGQLLLSFIVSLLRARGHRLRASAGHARPAGAASFPHHADAARRRHRHRAGDAGLPSRALLLPAARDARPLSWSLLVGLALVAADRLVGRPPFAAGAAATC